MSEGRKIMQVRSARQVPVRVQLLDDEILDITVDKRAVGWILFDKVCEHLNVLEKDYFGLNFLNPEGIKYWLDNEKKISKQMKGLQSWQLCFEIKFYPSDPLQMVEDLTRYQLCLQIRRDIVNERVPCSTVTYALLGSFTAQSELGDFEVEEFGSGSGYLKDIQFAPHQDRDLLSQIAKLHRSHKGLTPEDAELKFLENAKKLALFGVELHPAQDAEGKDIQLGVCASGILVYKDKQQVNRFVWPKILKMSYRRNKFYIKIRPGEFENFASLIGFRTAGIKMAKRLWKICVEHHSFFRFKEPEPTKSLSVIPRFGSRFRYSGRTQYQSRQVVADEARDAPYFDRVLSKRGTFGGRTTNMRQRDDDRKKQRDEMRRGPPPPAPYMEDSKQAPRVHEKEMRVEPNGTPQEPKRTPPEPRHAPPVAPKPKPVIAPKPRPSPRGPPSVDDNVSYDRGSRGSLNDSFEDIPDKRTKMERMHAVMTPLAAVMQKSLDKNRNLEESEEEDRHSDRDDRHGRRDRYEDEMDSRPITPEVIDQDVAPEPIQQAPLSVKERKEMEKQEKEKAKREKEQDKLRKKEEEKERKRLEKEKKALQAAEKKAAKQKSKQKVPTKKELERRDSKASSADIGRDWDEARAQEHPGSVTPDRNIKRLSSFEEKNKREKAIDVDDYDDDDSDQPPTPPAPLEGSLKGRQKGRRGNKKEPAESEGSDYVSDEDHLKEPRRRGDGYDEEEEVSF